jgi:hypothetical protein
MDRGNSTSSVQSSSAERNNYKRVLHRWKCNSACDMQLSYAELIIISVSTLAKQLVARKLGLLVQAVLAVKYSFLLFNKFYIIGSLSVVWSRYLFRSEETLGQ